MARKPLIVDVQNTPDYRKVDINKAGVKGIKYPIIVLDKKNNTQHTIATINMYVDLPCRFKGTHMSRFIEILNRYRQGINVKNLFTILHEMKKKLNAKSAHLEIEFPYFIEKSAPVSKAKSLMEYTCRLWGSLSYDRLDTTLGVEVPVTTLCPCSKQMSAKGAHNQRGIISIKIKFKGLFWIEDVIKIAEKSASCEVYSLLKRPDEKHVTDKAYNNPMFVEDVVRTIAGKLQKNAKITWFSVESENLESIHNHNAYALVEKSLCN
jgi:GTP cyclohydrolase I